MEAGAGRRRVTRVSGDAHASATPRGSRRKSSRCRRASPRGWAGVSSSPSTSSRRSRSFNGGSVEQALRAAVQQQRQVGYVFAGSEPTLMEQMIGPKRPFYKAGPVMRLRKIPGEVFAGFLDERFRALRSSRRRPASVTAIVDLAGNLPYDVQRLAHETWDDAWRRRRKRVERRRSARDAAPAAHRAGHVVRSRLAAADARAAQHDARGRARAGRRTSRARRPARGTASAAPRASRPRSPPSSAKISIVREDDGHYAVVDSLMREWVARKTY